ncbi:hypothetical protein NKG05_29510 [Oerskovia sp. M15]
MLAGQASYVALRGEGTSWFASLADAMDGLQPETWVGAVGVVLALLGLWLVWQAVRPRPRTTRRISATSGIHMRSADIARWVNATARDVPGVLDTSTSVSAPRYRSRSARPALGTSSTTSATRSPTSSRRSSNRRA